MDNAVSVHKHEFSNKKVLSRLDFLLEYYKPGNILDLGNVGGVFGQGKSNSFHIDFANKVKDSSKVYGFDLFLPQNLKYYPNQKQGDIEKGLPYKDRFFDTVYMGELLEHLSMPGFVLDEISRILKDNGVLIIDVPNPYSLYRIASFVTKREENLFDPTHVIFYTPASLKSILHRHGFTVQTLACKYPNWYNYLPSLLIKGLGTHLIISAGKRLS